MAKYCPITKKKVVYLTCMDCDTKVCQGETEDVKIPVRNVLQPSLFPNEIVDNKKNQD
jgi:hypothetical protein